MVDGFVAGRNGYAIEIEKKKEQKEHIEEENRFRSCADVVWHAC